MSCKSISFSPNSCWLSLQDGLIWSFFAPVCLIIFVNVFFFIITVWKLAQKFSSLNPDLTKLHKIKSVCVFVCLLALQCGFLCLLVLQCVKPHPFHYVVAELKHTLVKRHREVRNSQMEEMSVQSNGVLPKAIYLSL